MKTILVLAQHPELAEAIRAVLNPDQYRVSHRLTIEESQPLLESGLLDACCLDLESMDVRGQWLLESLFRRLKNRPILVFADSRQPEWEEEAYAKGVAYVLRKPVRARLLNAVLDRLWAKSPTPVPVPFAPPPPPVLPQVPPAWQRAAHESPTAAQSLQVLLDFSTILTHSLQAEPMLRQFLLLIREILGVNRAAIFLRRPLALFGNIPKEESRFLRSACAVGLSPGLLEHFQLSFETGIGGYLFRQGRILRRDSAEAARDLEIQKEFELLGAQVAIPMLDRETLVGVAALDGRVTGEILTSSELALIFHLLEELGLAIKNIWLHEQLATNHEMMANILRELSSACVVVNRDLMILHANKTARNLFCPPSRRGTDLEFNDLPQALGSKIYQVLHTGAAVVPFKFEPPTSPGSVFHVAVVPFQKHNSTLPSSALLIVDDQTQSEQFRRLELEAANLRLVRTMAERLAHEINNAVMPLDTYRQIMQKEIKALGAAAKSSDFWNSFYQVLGDSVKRIARRGSQMRALAQDSIVVRKTTQLAKLVQEAYEEAQKHQPSSSAKLTLEGEHPPVLVVGDEDAFRLAISEVFLNALQIEAKEIKIQVRILPEIAASDSRLAQVEIQDNGPGFTPEALQNAFKPFYRSKVIGLGLGLTVAQKILELHKGKIELRNAPENAGALVRLALPTDSGKP